jgi:hypothetical protein
MSLPPHRAHSIGSTPGSGIPTLREFLLSRDSCEVKHAFPAPIVADALVEILLGEPMPPDNGWVFIEDRGEVDVLLHQCRTP